MKNGFSLVELSIVLVILGLLTGGILAGKSLIRAAELRAVTSEYSRYATAIRTFRDKYFAIPGDFSNAIAFWGEDPNCNSHAAPFTGTLTCNGGGDGLIHATRENFNFWRHLANAGLIEGSYSGIAGPGNINWDSIPGTNVPASKFPSGGWSALSLTYASNGIFPAITNGSGGYLLNQLQFGGKIADLWTYEAILTPEELWNIDTKLDDGKPGTGLLVANNWGTCTDAASAAAAATGTPNYRLSTTSAACSIIFMPRGTGL